MLEEIILIVILITPIRIHIQTEMPRIVQDASGMKMVHTLMCLTAPLTPIVTRTETGTIAIPILAIKVIQISILTEIVATIVIDVMQSRRLSLKQPPLKR